jgi:hypothetical protein
LAVRSLSHRWLTFAAWLALLQLLLFYALPGLALFLLGVLAAGFFIRRGAIVAIATVLSVAMATAVYALAVHFSGLDKAIYYRPHEQLATFNFDARHRTYRPNEALHMQVPHGDLKALTGASLAVPHDVEFRTDADGFRNDADYHGQRYVLVGDSFVVGMNDSQADTLSAQLRRDYGLDTYNLGQPGDLGDYRDYVSAFRERHGGDFRALLFIFEGNDLAESVPPTDRARTSSVVLGLKRYHAFFSGTAMYRVNRSLIKRASARADIAASQQVLVARVGSHEAGFYTPYVDATRATTYAPDASVGRAILALRPQLAQIFFIPTKYRVYARQVDPALVLPNARWNWLDAFCKKEAIACTDLTPALTAAASKALQHDELIWWPDDTHWNRAGMAVAARVVAASLR